MRRAGGRSRKRATSR